MTTSVQITVPAADYVDADDCLQAAADAYAATHDLGGWDLSPRWTDEQRDSITLTVPAFAAA